jgi:hypothetical protein
MVVVDHADIDQLVGTIAACFARRRPFHWDSDKGSTNRRRMVDDVMVASRIRVCVDATLADHRHQEHTRHQLLCTYLLPVAARIGVTEFATESRTDTDNHRDVREIRNWYRTAGPMCPQMRFANKTDPLTWVADAAAGIWSDVVLDRPGEGWFTALATKQRITQATWVG